MNLTQNAHQNRNLNLASDQNRSASRSGLRRRHLLAMMVSSLLPLSESAAQDYPSRPVRVVVPWPAGGFVDVAARAVSQRLQVALGQSLVIENKAGAGGMIGAEQVARSGGDGYTVLLTTSALTMNAAIRGAAMPFDIARDLEPIGAVASVPAFLIVPAEQGPRTLAELIAKARSAPGKLSYASAGQGSPAHLSGELLKSQQRLFIVHVPYRGAPQAMSDVIAGLVDFQFAPVAVALPQMKAGKVRALAVTSSARYGGAPDVPTMAQAGVPNFEADQWLGMFAPKGTPRAVVERLSAELNRLLGADELKAVFGTSGLNPASASTPAAFAAYLQQDLARWAAVVKAANIKPE